MYNFSSKRIKPILLACGFFCLGVFSPKVLAMYNKDLYNGGSDERRIEPLGNQLQVAPNAIGILCNSGQPITPMADVKKLEPQIQRILDTGIKWIFIRNANIQNELILYEFYKNKQQYTINDPQNKFIVLANANAQNSENFMYNPLKTFKKLKCWKMIFYKFERQNATIERLTKVVHKDSNRFKIDQESKRLYDLFSVPLKGRKFIFVTIKDIQFEDVFNRKMGNIQKMPCISQAHYNYLAKIAVGNPTKDKVLQCFNLDNVNFFVYAKNEQDPPICIRLIDNRIVDVNKFISRSQNILNNTDKNEKLYSLLIESVFNEKDDKITEIKSKVKELGFKVCDYNKDYGIWTIDGETNTKESIVDRFLLNSVNKIDLKKIYQHGTELKDKLKGDENIQYIIADGKNFFDYCSAFWDEKSFEFLGYQNQMVNQQVVQPLPPVGMPDLQFAPQPFVQPGFVPLPPVGVPDLQFAPPLPPVGQGQIAPNTVAPIPSRKATLDWCPSVDYNEQLGKISECTERLENILELNKQDHETLKLLRIEKLKNQLGDMSREIENIQDLNNKRLESLEKGNFFNDNKRRLYTCASAHFNEAERTSSDIYNSSANLRGKIQDINHNISRFKKIQDDNKLSLTKHLIKRAIEDEINNKSSSIKEQITAQIEIKKEQEKNHVKCLFNIKDFSNTFEYSLE